MTDDAFDDDTGLEGAERMRAGIRAIHELAAVSQREAEIADAAPQLPPPDLVGRRLALTVRCPFCGVGPRSACETAGHRPMLLSPFHPGRLKSAEARQAQTQAPIPTLRSIPWT